MDNENAMTFSLEKERNEYHCKKRRKKIIKLLFALIVWVIVIFYLITPFSTYKMMHVKGNVYLKEEDILEFANIKSMWWWLVDKDELKEKLEEDKNIDNVSISKGFNGLTISILERYPLAIKNDKYLMNTTLNLLDKEEYAFKIEKLIDISEIEDKYLSLFSSQFIEVDLQIREVFYSGVMEDSKTIVLKGKFNESSYFEMKLNLDCLAIKLNEPNFLNIKREILGKISSDNVEYSKDNPCVVRYNLTNVYEYQIG